MNEILNKVEKLYTDSLKEHGVSSKAVGWTTGDGQILRFDKLVEDFSVNGAMFGKKGFKI